MRLTTNELTAVYGSGDGSSAFADQAFIATRPNLQQPFTTALAGIDTEFTNPIASTDAGAWTVIAESARESVDANFTTSTIVVNPPTNVDNATTNSGRLVVFFSEQDANGTNHIWTGTRSSLNEPFSNLTPVHELDSTGEYPTWFSDDGCRLYFTRGDFTQSALYVASR